MEASAKVDGNGMSLSVYVEWSALRAAMHAIVATIITMAGLAVTLATAPEVIELLRHLSP